MIDDITEADAAAVAALIDGQHPVKTATADWARSTIDVDEVYQYADDILSDDDQTFPIENDQIDLLSAVRDVWRNLDLPRGRESLEVLWTCLVFVRGKTKK